MDDHGICYMLFKSLHVFDRMEIKMRKRCGVRSCFHCLYNSSKVIHWLLNVSQSGIVSIPFRYGRSASGTPMDPSFL